MGREIRMVPPNWLHPKMEDRDGLQPMHDTTYAEARKEWVEGLVKWDAGERPSYWEPSDGDYWDYMGAPPDEKFYRPWEAEAATWFQLWETVSEGTPTSPPFATKQELVDYLASHGDFWDQKRCKEPGWDTLWGGVFGISGWGKEKAERFVLGAGWSPSMVISNGKVLTNPGDIAADMSN